MTSTLSVVSTGFAQELPELTHAIMRGEDVTRRIKVLREYMTTWVAFANSVHAAAAKR